MSRKRVVLGFGVWASLLLLVAVFSVALNVPVVKASGTIYIRADGSIDPPTAPISSVDNVTYTFTDNIYDSIVVERSTIVIDGNRHALQGSGSGNGFYGRGINNVTIKKTNILSFDHGIHLEVSSFNIISKNNITNGDTGLYLSWWSDNNLISGNNITDGRYGVRFSSSSNNTLYENNITNNTEIGVYLDGSLNPSNNNTLSDNTITENWYGVYLFWSPNNVLVNNSIVGNRYSFGVDARLHRLSDFVQNVDTSNTVDGKPVYYWVNRQNMDVPLDAGYVALVNSTNITVRGLELKNNCQGLLLAYTTNSHVTNNNITDNWIGVELYNSSHNSLSRNRITINEHGIFIRRSSKNNFLSGNNITNSKDQGLELFESSDNTVLGNNITDGRYGVGLWQRSHNNTIRGNNITNNSRGVWLSYSSNNTLSENNITNNYYGVGFEWSSNNKFYHNNFKDNTPHVYIHLSETNFWDDGFPSGGNYWSDYTGVDEKRGPDQDQQRSDGIGDTPYIIDASNRDNYPLMYQWPDTTPPTTTENYDDLWHVADFTIPLVAVDVCSGISETYYIVNDGPIQNLWADGEPFVTTESVNNKLEYWSVDNAGNEELPHKILSGIKLDKTAPTGSIVINNDATYATSTSVTLTLSADDTTSGIAQMRFSHDNTTWTPWEPYATSKAWTFTTGEGTKTVYVQYADNAGLISTTYQDTIIFDTTNPTANAGINQTVNEDTLFTFDGSASQDENGIVSYTWTFTDVTSQTLTGKYPTYTFTTPGTYKITLKVTDPAGNHATDTVLITVLDITKPIANAGQDQTVDVGATANFDADASSDNVGVVSYEWNFGDGTTGTGVTTSHVYSTPDTYTVTLTVKDLAGNTATDTITVTVRSAEAPTPPSADAFPLWIIGLAAAAIGIATVATILWRKRK